jgi:hypothetical protein
MAVIINEFEIITTPPSMPEQAEPQGQPKPEPPSLLRPEDIERVIRHQRQRLERIRAD